MRIPHRRNPGTPLRGRLLRRHSLALALASAAFAGLLVASIAGLVLPSP